MTLVYYEPNLLMFLLLVNDFLLILSPIVFVWVSNVFKFICDSIVDNGSYSEIYPAIEWILYMILKCVLSSFWLLNVKY